MDQKIENTNKFVYNYIYFSEYFKNLTELFCNKVSVVQF